MTTPLYLKDAYQTKAEGRVTGITEQGGIILDQSYSMPHPVVNLGTVER